MYIKTIEFKKLKLNQGVIINLDEFNEVALFLTQTGLHCVSNICPHQHFPKIYDGFVEEDTIRCSMHGWQFSLITGECLESGKAGINISGLKIFKCYEENGFVWIEKPETNNRPKWME